MIGFLSAFSMATAPGSPQVLGIKDPGGRSRGRKRARSASKFLTVAAALLCGPTRGAKSDDFSTTVAPILLEHCLVCHGGDAVEGGYDISTLAGISRPGDSSVEPIVAGDPTSSELLRRLVTDNDSELMPSGGPPLGAGQIDAIHRWIVAGAVLPDIDPNTRLIDVLEPVADYPLPPAVYPRPIPVTAVAAAADDTTVVGGYRELLVWQPGQTSGPQRWQGFGDYIGAVQISAKGDWLAVAHGTPGQRGEVTVARLTDHGLQDRRLVFRSGDVPAAIAFSPSGDLLAVSTLDGQLAVIELPAADAGADTADGSSANRPNAEPTAKSSGDGGADGPPLRLSLTPHSDAIAAVAWSTDGKDLLTASRDRTARVIRLADGQSTSNFTMHERAVHGVGQIPAGIVTLDETGTLRLWSAGSRNSRLDRSRVSDAALGLRCFQNTVLIPSSGSVVRLVVQQVEQEDGTDENGKPKKRRVPRWKELAPLEVAAGDIIISLAVSPAGNVVAGTQSGRLYHWERGATADRPQRGEPRIAMPQ